MLPCALNQLQISFTIYNKELNKERNIGLNFILVISGYTYKN